MFCVPEDANTDILVSLQFENLTSKKYGRKNRAC